MVAPTTGASHESRVKAEYPRATVRPRSALMDFVRKGEIVLDPGVAFFVYATDMYPAEEDMLGKGATEREAWRSASRKIAREAKKISS